MPDQAPTTDATAEFYQALNQPTRLERVGDSSRRYYGIYRCACGVEKEIYDYSVRKGAARSCGCLNSEKTSARNKTELWATKHGGSKRPEYRIWMGMTGRCRRGHKNYAARGIKVCDRWRESFANFLADMGPRPSSRHSIERKDNNGHYEPDNCVWATSAEQLRNTRRTRKITFNGKTQCLRDWATEKGWPYTTLRNRFVRGWSVERALTEPITGEVEK